MLVPVYIQNKRYWLEISATYEIWAPTIDFSELKRLIFKNVSVIGIYEDYEIAYDLKRTVASLLSRGYNYRQIVKEVSELYGIREEFVYEVIEDIIDRMEVIV